MRLKVIACLQAPGLSLAGLIRSWRIPTGIFPTFILFAFSPGAVFPQGRSGPEQEKLDSLHARLMADSARTYRFKILRPYANIDNRNSFIKKRPASFNGFQLGVIVNEYHTFGVGLYTLNRIAQNNLPVYKEYVINKLNYTTVFYEYMLIDKRFYEIDLPFELGYGVYQARLADSSDAGITSPVRSAYVPLGAGVKLILKPVRWIGLSLMVGYRYVYEADHVLNFNGFFYPLGVWIDFRQVYRDIKYYGFQKKRYRKAAREFNP